MLLLSGGVFSVSLRSHETKRTMSAPLGYDRDAGISKKRAASAASKAGENR
jgi:hypothetical protein